MPALFALGQHQALEAIQESLQPSETLMAFLDDVQVTTPPERTATVEQSVQPLESREDPSGEEGEKGEEKRERRGGKEGKKRKE